MSAVSTSIMVMSIARLEVSKLLLSDVDLALEVTELMEVSFSLNFDDLLGDFGMVFPPFLSGLHALGYDVVLRVAPVELPGGDGEGLEVEAHLLILGFGLQGGFLQLLSLTRR